MERLGWRLVGRISKCRRYVIDVTGLDLLYFGEWEHWVQRFGGSSELQDVLGRWKLVGVSGTCIA